MSHTAPLRHSPSSELRRPPLPPPPMPMPPMLLWLHFYYFDCKGEFVAKSICQRPARIDPSAIRRAAPNGRQTRTGPAHSPSTSKYSLRSSRFLISPFPNDAFGIRATFTVYCVCSLVNNFSQHFLWRTARDERSLLSLSVRSFRSGSLRAVSISPQPPPRPDSQALQYSLICYSFLLVPSFRRLSRLCTCRPVKCPTVSGTFVERCRQ